MQNCHSERDSEKVIVKRHTLKAQLRFQGKSTDGKAQTEKMSHENCLSVMCCLNMVIKKNSLN